MVNSVAANEKKSVENVLKNPRPTVVIRTGIYRTGVDRTKDSVTSTSCSRERCWQ